jgi:enoyl-CoA hydratase/carnithine racemase
MTSSLVTVDVRDSVGTVRLSRSETRNALRHEILDDLGEAFRTLETSPTLRAVILAGVSADAGESSERGQIVGDQIAKFAVPVIAAINGVVAGDGYELALACHLRIASTDAGFSIPETKVGTIASSGATQRLSHIIGSERALEMALSRRTISAEEAFRIGLVNRITDQTGLMREANSLAREISQLAPLAIRACLEAVRCGLELSLEEGLAIEAELFSGLFATEDVREGTSAFFEKRAPVFKGR